MERTKRTRFKFPLSLQERGVRGEVRIAFLILLLLTSSLFASPSDAQYIPARDYFQAVSNEINSAKTSVRVVLYLFSLYPNQQNSRTMRLANALVAAQKRGVSVDVLLDKGQTGAASASSKEGAASASSKEGGDPDASKSLKREAEQGSNREAYEFLAARGVKVGFADVQAIVHAKAVIIDSQTVIAGSANWSESALSRNVEASLIVRSAEVAKAALAELGNLKQTTPPAADSSLVHLPMKFFSSAAPSEAERSMTRNDKEGSVGSLSRMVTAGDERAYDLYLYLYRLVSSSFILQSSSPSSPSTFFDLNYDTVAAQLGIVSMGSVAYRRQINKVLEKLQDRYGLVTVRTAYDKDAEIKLAAMPGQAVDAPAKYWDYGWSRRLDFPGKVMYVLNQYYSSVSPSRPQWSMAADTIAKRHGLTRWFAITGTTSLRRANLVDVAYDSLQEKNQGARSPNIYTPLPLYDPAVLDAKWKELEKKYGKPKTDSARACAAIVYKDSDYKAVEKFILLQEKYGLDKMEQAEKIMIEKAPDNPKRCVGYFIGIVRGLK